MRRDTRSGTRLALLLTLVVAGPLWADVILSAEALNASLKKLQRLQQQIAAAQPPERAEAVFDLGVESDALATLMNDEVAAHGMQEKPLLDLALERTRELEIALAWDRAKERFFYDGAAFRRYLTEAPRGPRVAEASFWEVENEFYQSTGTAAEPLLLASAHKQEFLRQHPKFALAADVAVFLAIDYRDLYRIYQEKADLPSRDRFRERAREQFREVGRRHPGTDQARIAREMLQRFEAEVRTREGPR